VKALIQICSVNDSDVLAMAILRSWEREGSLLLLIKGMLIEEIRMTGKTESLSIQNLVLTERCPLQILNPSCLEPIQLLRE
jgi:hypothetical protein